MSLLLPDRLKKLWRSIELRQRPADDYEPLKDQWFDEYKAIWADAVLLPGCTDLQTSMLTELGRYMGCEDLAEIRRRCHTAPKELAKEWEERVNPKDRASIERFYDASKVEIYGLAWWHVLEDDLTPLSYVLAMQFAKERGCRSYLDFGSGVGTGSLIFTRAGIQSTCADISSPMLEFCRFRHKIRGWNGQFIDLKKQAPPAQTYDMITAMDVFEHLFDPVEAVERLIASLKPGGYIMGRWAVEKGDDRGAHIVTDFGPTRKRMAELGMVRVWHDDWVWGHEIFQKQ